eukprot:159366_1
MEAILFLFMLYSLAVVNSASFNLTYGRLKFNENKPDSIVSFKTSQEYKLFLESNNLDSDINEPAYLVKCIEANKNLKSACLDGTPQIFYFRPGYDDGVNKFVIYIQGGGWCTNINSCYSRSQGSLGSTKDDEPYIYIEQTKKGDGYMYNTYGSNPLAYNWNTVYVRYCDGMSFSGNNFTNITTSGNTTIYFRGWNNLNAVFDKLRDDYGLNNATNVLFTGSSAGGLSTWLHSDYIGDYVRKYAGDNVDFMAMPDSGFFMDYEKKSGGFESNMKWIFENANNSIALNEECIVNNNEEEYKCMFAQYTAPYIKSKMFVLQSRFDSYQINDELDSNNVTLINEYGNNLTSVIMDTYINKGKYIANHALFLDSCEHHTDKWNQIIIDAFNSSSAEVDWWFGNSSHSKVYFQNMTYPCKACCTPS